MIEKINKKAQAWWIILIIGIVLLILVGIYVFSDIETKKECAGTHTETYTVSTKGCDGMQNCRCLHEGWGGLGACDSCECTKEVSNC